MGNSSSGTPFDALDQPTVYPQGPACRFDTNFGGIDKSEELIQTIHLLDIYPGCAVTIHDNSTTIQSTTDLS